MRSSATKSMLLIVVTAAAAIAQKTDWTNVKGLTIGGDIRVSLEGKSFRGQVQNVTDDSLILFAASSQQTLARSEIKKVDQGRKPSPAEHPDWPGHRLRRRIGNRCRRRFTMQRELLVRQQRGKRNRDPARRDRRNNNRRRLAHRKMARSISSQVVFSWLLAAGYFLLI